MPTAFATPDELALYTGTTVGAERAQFFLDLASDAIRAAAGQRLDLVTDDEVTFPGRWGREFVLPERPVVDVTAVAIDGAELAATAWEFDGRDTLRLVDAAAAFDTDGHGGHFGGSCPVTITYSHGWADIPPALRAVCLAVAARALATPDGVVQESVGGYSVAYSRVAGVALTPAELDVVAAYRPDPNR